MATLLAFAATVRTKSIDQTECTLLGFTDGGGARIGASLDLRRPSTLSERLSQGPTDLSDHSSRPAAPEGLRGTPIKREISLLDTAPGARRARFARKSVAAQQWNRRSGSGFQFQAPQVPGAFTRVSDVYADVTTRCVSPWRSSSRRTILESGASADISASRTPDADDRVRRGPRRSSVHTRPRARPRQQAGCSLTSGIGLRLPRLEPGGLVAQVACAGGGHLGTVPAIPHRSA